MAIREASASMTVAEVLALPEIQAGNPEIVAGKEWQEREIRWVHVVAGDIGAADLLDGGELILTTGVGWPTDDSSLQHLALSLVTLGNGAGVAAIVLELGSTIESAPSQFVEACEKHGVPLIVLHHEVRFVQITQRVHQHILAAQTEALLAREAVHIMLTELGLNRSPVDYVVERIANILDSPIVLEDSANRVVALADNGEDPTVVLDPWVHDRVPILPLGSVRVSVEAKGNRWGYLTALPGPPHAAGRKTVLELGAIALALGRFADPSTDSWLQLASKRIFNAFLEGRYRNDVELEAQLSAAGIPFENRDVFVATLRGEGDFGEHFADENALLEKAFRHSVSPSGSALITSDISFDDQRLLILLSLPRQHHESPISSLATHFNRELGRFLPASVSVAWRAHLTISYPIQGLRQLIAALEQLRTTRRLPASFEVGKVAVQHAIRDPLGNLVQTLISTPELQEFSRDMLMPLFKHDQESGPQHSGDLIRVLNAYIEHPTNRSLAAEQANLSRSVFYQRIELIESLLNVDLHSGRTIAALAVALFTHARS